MGNKKQRFTSGNKGLEKAVKSMAEHMRANSTSPSDRVRPDSQNNLASQPISDDDDDFFGIPAGTTPTSLSDRIRPELKNHLPSKSISDDDDDLFGIPAGTTPTSLSDRIRPELKNHLPSKSISDDDDDLFGIPYGATPTSLSDRVRPDIIGFQGESNSTTDNDWEEVVFNVTSGESHFDVENSFPGCISEATVGLVKNSQSNEEACPDLFIEKVAQADLLQENPINSSKSLYSTHLPNNVMTGNRVSVCDVAPPTSPIIKMDKGSNAPLRIALDFCQKHHLVLCDKMLWIYNGQYYVPLTESDAQRYIFSEYCDDVSRGNTMSLIKNIVSLLRVTVADTVEMFPTNEHIIVFRNGTLEVANDYFRENSPGDLASSALSIDYDPNQKEMPVTNKFLNTITNGDSVLYKRLLQVIGYILSNDLRAKSFFYLEGVGNAGKSRFCDLIASFFSVNGANKVSRIALQDLGNKFSMANLVNTKLNISEDLPDKPLSQVTVSRIKMISDANCLEAEAKFIQSFSFKPQCKLLFASNHPLKIKDKDDAFVNRVIYIPFKNPIPKGKQDKHILEKMQQELPALFNYAYSAYKQLVESGYSWAGINIFKPEIVITNLSSAEEREYAMKLFVELYCEESQDSTVAISEIQRKYNEFCDEYKYVPVVGDRFSREIYKFLPGTPERVKIGNQKRGFKGVCLK